MKVLELTQEELVFLATSAAHDIGRSILEYGKEPSEEVMQGMSDLADYISETRDEFRKDHKGGNAMELSASILKKMLAALKQEG